MSKATKDKVKQFLDDIQFQAPEKFDILSSARKLILNSNAELLEDIKYGGLVYFLSDELLGGLFVYKNHLSLELGKGAELSDPDSILEGTGKYRRHIKMRTTDDIRSKKVKAFVEKVFTG